MSETVYEAPQTVLVTGGGGHLGSKAVNSLGEAGWCRRIISILYGDEAPSYTPAAREKVSTIRADLTQPGAWQDAMAGVQAVLHIAASNPVPDSSWTEAQASFDMTSHVGLAALRHGVRRLVFLSSNHVVGGYKDAPLLSQMGPGRLKTSLPPAPGTHWKNGDKVTASTAYASSKVMGERLMAALAAASQGTLSTVCIRIGWALTGDNRASDVNLSGTPGDSGSDADLDEDDARTLRWFRNMWLSNRDFSQIIRLSLEGNPEKWPSPSIIVNGVSNNSGMDWSLEEGTEWLGYVPQDDLFAILRESAR